MYLPLVGEDCPLALQGGGCLGPFLIILMNRLCCNPPCTYVHIYTVRYSMHNSEAPLHALWDQKGLS